jgi:hypothetical protein
MVPSILQPVPETDDDKAVRRLEQRDAKEVGSKNTYTTSSSHLRTPHLPGSPPPSSLSLL